MADFLAPHFTLKPHSQNCWQLIDQAAGFSCSSLPPTVHYTSSDGRPREVSISWDADNQTSCTADPLGTGGTGITYQQSRDGLHISMDFYFPHGYRVAMFRLRLENQSQHLIRPGWIELIRPQDGGNIDLNQNSSQLACFVNGWQSWSSSRLYHANEKQRVSGLRFAMEPMWHNQTTPIFRQPGHFASDMFTTITDPASHTGILVGFLSQKQHFGHAEVNLTGQTRLCLKANADGIELPAGAALETDWAVFQSLDFSQAEPMQAYLDAAAHINHVRHWPDTPVGWCSWYHFFTHLEPFHLTENTRMLSDQRERMPVDLVQIDDGFEKAIGSWLEFKPSFKDGLTPIVRDIRQKGFTPGVWLAPFIVHPAADIKTRKPWMLLKGQRGGYASAGWNWNRFTNGLDMTHPEAQDYVRTVIQTAVNDWGFPYLKLDFLYAGCLPGRYSNPRLTRAMVFDQAMSLVREAAGSDTFLLGCGAPIGGILGHVDGMRIGTDVALDWKPKYKGIELLFPNEPNIPSVENAMHNTVTRSMFHNHWWLNDPDCLLLRTTTNLTEDEVRTQAALTALSGGMLLLSDDLTQVPEERLRMAKVQLPVIGKTPRVLDWHQSGAPARLRVDLENAAGMWSLISFTNWSDRAVTHPLTLEEFDLDPNQDWIIREFWQGTPFITQHGKLPAIHLPAHGTWLASVRPLVPGKTQFAGSDLHISQGLEIHTLKDGGRSLTLTCQLPGRSAGSVWFYTPEGTAGVIVDGKPAAAEVADGFTRIPLEFTESVQIKLIL
jgi:alpha-galactosidase